jgi:hypothetical protein
MRIIVIATRPQVRFARHGLEALTVVPRAPNFCAFARVSSKAERAEVSTS